MTVVAANRAPIVVHLATSLDFGGVETHLATIGETRARASFEPVFCALSSGGAVADELTASGARVICLQARARIPSPGAILALWRLLRRLQPAVLHAHGAEANFHGMLAGTLARVPVLIAEEIGIPGHGTVARRVFGACYRLSDAVIGVSGSVTRWLLANGEVPAAKAVTLHNPVRLPEGRGDVRPPDDIIRFCHVGRLEPVKNLGALLDAFASLLATGAGAELWLVGEGSQRRDLERQAADLGIGAQVRFLGFQTDPAPLLRQCHVSLQPSLSEGFGLAMVEAMGCELPVLSTRVGAAEELIDDGRTGWLVDGFDAPALHHGLLRACTPGTGQLLAMGRAARLKVHSMFTPGDYLARVERLYAARLAAKEAP